MINNIKISPSDLRIGNKLIWNKKRIITVIDIMSNGINSTWDNPNNLRIPLSQLTPIRLYPTEIADFKMPFEEKPITIKSKTMHGIYTLYDCDNLVEINWRSEKRIDMTFITSRGTFKMKRVNLEYFHQFQNLYYIITGKDIEFEGDWNKTTFDL